LPVIYGLYLSANGVLANSYRQDVIANNLANAESVGFKKDLATFQQRDSEAKARGLGPNATNPLLEPLGGGTLASHSRIDLSQGDLEHSDNNLDAGIQGKGFFTVSDRGQTRLTRDGRFTLDRSGRLVLPRGQQVLDVNGKPITLDSHFPDEKTTIGPAGEIFQGEKQIAQLGFVNVPDPKLLTKHGDGMMDYPDLAKNATPATGKVKGGFTESSNVEPATELTQLMDAQRQLEANANMIRYQDQTLQRLCNDVGKVS
jgi:flagellar basal-body rod protein FlgF